mmetsp:Transcript_119784/g.382346  ORF Transcript_119784/g.382346 Transcript_119784/m.382346 type:complete len:190 (+) Transcript_119784:177-746(+)
MTVALRMPFQLFPGDRYNVALGVLLLFALAGLKDFERLPSVVRWQMNAYTNWSLALLTLGIATGQKQWEPFLCANSIGLLVGYRTAMAQGLDGNLIKKFKSHGVIFLETSVRIVGPHVAHSSRRGLGRMASQQQDSGPVHQRDVLRDHVVVVCLSAAGQAGFIRHLRTTPLGQVVAGHLDRKCAHHTSH